MKIRKDVRKFSVEHCNISREDYEKFLFPQKMQKVIRIQKVNGEEALDYTDKYFADQYKGYTAVATAKPEDRIYIEFVSGEYPNIKCLLRIEDIETYYCTIYDANDHKNKDDMQMETTLDGFRLRILKDIENNYPFYFVNANTDFLGIFANKVVIESLDYVE